MKSMCAGLMFVGFPAVMAVAQSQPEVVATLNWTEVYAGTSTPVANPNGAIDPGEGALLTLSLSFTPIGTSVPFQRPSPGVGSVAGFAALAFGLSGESAGQWSNHEGRWNSTPGISFGNSLIFAGGNQPWPPVGALPDPINPVSDFWQISWAPDSYTTRIDTFEMSGTTAMPELYVHHGLDPQGNPLLGLALSTLVLDSVVIPIVPAPGPAFAIGAAMGLACFRRRRHLQ